MAVYELTSARVGTPTGTTPRPAPVLLVDGFTSPNATRLRWTPAAGPAPTGWRFWWRRTGGTWSTPATIPAASTWLEAAGLLAATGYEFQLAALHSGTESTRATVTATTQAAGTSAPGDVALSKATKNSLAITWTWPLLEGVGGFKVYLRVAGTSAWSGPVDVGGLARAATLSGLAAGTAYDVRVYAWVTPLLGVTRYGNSSTTATFTTSP